LAGSSKAIGEWEVAAKALQGSSTTALN